VISVTPLTILKEKATASKGRTIRKVMGGGGLLACQNFFFGPFPLQEFFFFGYSPMHEFFFVFEYFPYAQFAIELIKNNATLFYY